MRHPRAPPDKRGLRPGRRRLDAGAAAVAGVMRRLMTAFGQRSTTAPEDGSSARSRRRSAWIDDARELARGLEPLTACYKRPHRSRSTSSDLQEHRLEANQSVRGMRLACHPRGRFWLVSAALREVRRGLRRVAVWSGRAAAIPMRRSAAGTSPSAPLVLGSPNHTESPRLGRCLAGLAHGSCTSASSISPPKGAAPVTTSATSGDAVP